MTVLNADLLDAYVAGFNELDNELYPQYIPNAEALAWMQQNVPRFECPDKEIESTYYFRWWTFRKHIKQTEDGFVVTEFLPKVSWAGKHNTISCPAGHHFREGRWLANKEILRDYAVFWLRKGGEPRRYSFWIADSILALTGVTGDLGFAIDLLPELIANYEAWTRTHRGTHGVYWQMDDRDGMECSISGRLSPDCTGYRATINSYMFGDAMAIAKIAGWAGQNDISQKFQARAAEIKRLTQEHLWDERDRFFKVLPRTDANAKLADVRELHGYTPWYFNLPDVDKSDAWLQLMDPQGFYAPFGPTTAEQRHPEFSVSYEGHCCKWDGPGWPFSTAVTLTGMANLLNNYQQDYVSKRDYFETLKIYTQSHRMMRDDGTVVPWIDENLNPYTGEWLARSMRKKSAKDNPLSRHIEELGKDYNHSSYCDLVINGLVGLRPREDDVVEVNPLIPESWDYFCLDGVHYRGMILTILFDKTGQRYGRGEGLRILVDGSSSPAA